MRAISSFWENSPKRLSEGIKTVQHGIFNEGHKSLRYIMKAVEINSKTIAVEFLNYTENYLLCSWCNELFNF